MKRKILALILVFAVIMTYSVGLIPQKAKAGAHVTKPVEYNKLIVNIVDDAGESVTDGVDVIIASDGIYAQDESGTWQNYTKLKNEGNGIYSIDPSTSMEYLTTIKIVVKDTSKYEEYTGDNYTYLAGMDGEIYKINDLVFPNEIDTITFTLKKKTGGQGQSATKYNITVNGGTANPKEAEENAQVEIEADAAPQGQVFDRWIVDEDSTTVELGEKATEAKTTFTMPKGNVSLTATYKNETPVLDAKITSVEPSTKSLPATGGDVTFTVKGENLPSQLFYTISYRIHAMFFDMEFKPETQIEAVGKETERKFSINLPGVDKTEIDYYEVSVAAKTGGEKVKAQKINVARPLYDVTVEGGKTAQTKYNKGDKVTIEATSKENEEFVEWEVVSGGAILDNKGSATTTFDMPANSVVIKAIYKIVTPPQPQKYAVTVVGGNADKGEYEAGEKVKLIAAPVDEGKVFKKWAVESTIPFDFEQSNLMNGTFVMPACPVKVTATYEDVAPLAPVMHNVTLQYDGKANEPEAYEVGKEVKLSAPTSLDGKDFEKWEVVSGDVTIKDLTAKNIAFEMPDSDVVLNCIFKKKEVTPDPNEENPTIEEDKYELITSASVSKWTKNSGLPLEFKFDIKTGGANVDHLLDIIDLSTDKSIGQTNYEVREGSVIVKLTDAYANSLEPGKYNFRAMFDNKGTVDFSFEVLAAKVDNSTDNNMDNNVENNVVNDNTKKKTEKKTVKNVVKSVNTEDIFNLGLFVVVAILSVMVFAILKRKEY